MHSEDEAGKIIINHINALDNNPEVKFGRIRSDNETGFMNSMTREFCEEKRIVHEFYAPRTPQQNGVVKRKKRTLIEVARTMPNEEKITLHSKYLSDNQVSQFDSILDL